MEEESGDFYSEGYNYDCLSGKQIKLKPIGFDLPGQGHGHSHFKYCSRMDE